MTQDHKEGGRLSTEKTEIYMNDELESNNSVPLPEETMPRKEFLTGRLKIDVFVLGFLVLMFIHLQLDRTNLGNALTDGFASQLGMTQTQINTGQTLFTLAIVLFELPSNIIVKRMGPHIWLPGIMLAWGIITMCQASLKNEGGYYATRFILAMCEAGTSC